MTTLRNSKRAAKLAALAVLTSGSLLAVASGPLKAVPAAAEPLVIITAAGRKTLHVEIADTPSEQALGLMYRTQLADDHGMIFLHPGPRELTMWMRNTYIPLDMVFIKADGRVHRIEVKTQPMSEAVIASGGEVTAVLELAGGAAERLGLKPGDTIVHRHFAAPQP
jgi:uncharacterized protein